MRAKQKNMHHKKVLTKVINVTIIGQLSCDHYHHRHHCQCCNHKLNGTSSSPDYSQGFGGKYGVQKDRVDKVSFRNDSLSKLFYRRVQRHEVKRRSALVLEPPEKYNQN